MQTEQEAQKVAEAILAILQETKGYVNQHNSQIWCEDDVSEVDVVYCPVCCNPFVVDDEVEGVKDARNFVRHWLAAHSGGFVAN